MTAQPIPVLQAMLASFGEAAPLDPSLDITDLRAFADAGVINYRSLVRDHGPLHDVRDLTIGGVPCRLYLASADAGERLHIHVHGGGWWMGSIETADAMARELAHVSGMAVLSVGYRLAPEHPFPAGLDDLTSVLTHLDELDFSPTTVSVGGESAGANLTAAACLGLRGDIDLVAQWLDVPCVDLSLPVDASYEAYRTGYGLEMSQAPVLKEWYGGDVSDPQVSPALAPDLSGLPPTIVTTAECDPLRDQGERFARALEAHGNPVVYRCNPGQVHASSWMTALTPDNAAWYAETVGLLVAQHDAVAVAR